MAHEEAWLGITLSGRGFLDSKKVEEGKNA
jgi:hypothetical protein